MALTDLDHRSTPRAPFGAISIFRASEALLSGATALRRAFQAAQTRRVLAEMSPAQREDIGVRLSEAETEAPGLLARIVAFVAERRARAQTLRTLRALTPAQLDDIGLSEADLVTYQRTGRLD